MQCRPRLSVLFALVAFSLPTIAQQVSAPVRLPRLDDVPDPRTSSLSHIEAQSGDLPEGLVFELYRWDRFPSVLVLDMADFSEQDRMFSRLAFYLEKAGFRGRLLTDAELAGKHGWNAHDYGPDGLAAFFNAASVADFPLDPEELLLRGIASREGIVRSEGEGYSPGAGAILSISRSSSKYERILLLGHESYHGVFFCSEEYRTLCDRLWRKAPSTERLFMTRLLAALGYDPSSRALVVNEFQAYLLQQPSSGAAAYFERVGKLVAEESGVPTAETVLPSLLADERELESFLRMRYAIESGGRVFQPARGG